VAVIVALLAISFLCGIILVQVAAHKMKKEGRTQPKKPWQKKGADDVQEDLTIGITTGKEMGLTIDCLFFRECITIQYAKHGHRVESRASSEIGNNLLGWREIFRTCHVFRAKV
jgi:hypothetical protein